MTDIFPSADETARILRGRNACLSNLQDAWAAMRMIREAVETLGPIGAMPAEEHLAGPTFLHEAEAIVAGIMKMKAADPVAVALQAAMAFIDAHVADPDITQKMRETYARLQSLKPHDLLKGQT